jgi:hypothetical protein
MSASVPPVTRIDPADIMPTLLVAFADDPGMRWLYPDDETYERAFPEVVLLAAGAAFDTGTVDVAEDGAAVAIWDPPGVRPGPGGGRRGLGRPLPGTRRRRTVGRRLRVG